MKIFHKLAALSILIFIVSCQSKEQKTDDAFDTVKVQKTEQKDSAANAKEQAPVQKETEPIKKAELLDEWSRFRSDMETKIAANQAKIKTLKGASNTNTKTFRKIARLENDNSSLRKQMDDYCADAKARQVKFVASTLADVKEITASLNDMALPVKK